MTTPATPLLQLRGLCVQADGAALLQDIELDLAPGELVGIIGPNGAGKSTLLRCLAGIETTSSGELLLDARPLAQLGLGQRARTIAWLEQRPQLHWPLRVEQVVALGRLPWRASAGADATASTAVENALARCGLLDLRGRDCQSLSEGEKLLVNLARVLAVEARLLLADEPTTALDPRQQHHVMRLLQQEARSGKAVLAVLHDLTLAARYCTRLVLLQQGRVVASGSMEEVLTPQHLAAVYGINAAYDPALQAVIISPQD